LTDPRLRRDLDRRAAEWFRSRDMPWPALRYALAGGHWGLAADLVSIHVFALVARQSPGQLEALLAPLPMEVLLVHPAWPSA
jgi:ATP/maltotriose-dependent transcriptional regulator MalT